MSIIAWWLSVELIILFSISRLNPPLPKGYFGNQVQPAIVTLNSNDVKQKTLCEIAKLVRQRLQFCMDDKTVRQNLEWIRTQLKNGISSIKLTPNWDMTSNRHFQQTSWAQYPLYSTDFFGLGGPIWVDQYAPICCPGFVVILPAPPSVSGGGRIVNIASLCIISIHPNLLYFPTFAF